MVFVHAYEANFAGERKKDIFVITISFIIREKIYHENSYKSRSCQIVWYKNVVNIISQYWITSYSIFFNKSKNIGHGTKYCRKFLYAEQFVTYKSKLAKIDIRGFELVVPPFWYKFNLKCFTLPKYVLLDKCP